MRILITGGCGFVGSSISLYLRDQYPGYEIIAFDNLKRRGSELNVNRLKERNIEFVHGDIRCKEDLQSIAPVEVIIDASAEPSVMAGIHSSPEYAIQTNLMGTIHALNFARLCGASFIFLSTSRVYPINQIERIKFTENSTRFEIDPVQDVIGVGVEGINEQFPLDGYRSLYGATKLSSEIMLREYNHFYGVKTVINRCGVLAGPWQMGKVDQGVTVLWLARHFWKQPLSYFGFGGKGKQVRDILHIADLCRLVDRQIHDINAFNGQLFNVGGGVPRSLSLQEMTRLTQKVTGNKVPVHEVAETREADIRVYITNNARIKNLCGWEPRMSLEEIFEETFDWIRENEKSLELILKQ